MSAERPKAGRRKSEQSRHGTTPESATSLEKERLDDEAVEKAVTAGDEPAETGTKSILPCPPIPPDRQAEVAGKGAQSKDRPSPTRKREKKTARR